MLGNGIDSVILGCTEIGLLVRPEDLGVHAAVLGTTDESGAARGLGAPVTPVYYLVDDNDRLLATLDQV